MKCPYCRTPFQETWVSGLLNRVDGAYGYAWLQRHTGCPDCDGVVIELRKHIGPDASGDWIRVVPRAGEVRRAALDVPPHLARDHHEATAILPLSANGAAALARRCLHGVLHDNGYRQAQLWTQLDAVLAESHTTKELPHPLPNTIAALRDAGDFAAQSIDAVTALPIIEANPAEIEIWLNVIDELFDHFYVKPATAAKIAALNAKLASRRRLVRA